MNLNAGNGNTEQVLDAIRTADPDLLLLEKVTPKWAHELAVLNTAYPHRIAEPQSGCFGIMLLSKYPLARERVVGIAIHQRVVGGDVGSDHFPVIVDFSIL